MTLKNALLAISLVSFAVGFSELQENLVFWMGRPVGAIVFILYFILLVLEKPFATMDAENGIARSKESSPTKAPTPALATTTR